MDVRQPYGLKLVTESTIEPVKLDEFKLSQRIDWDDEDGLLASYLTAARKYIEGITNRQFVNATWRLALDCFPCWEIRFPRAPLASVSSIQYVDSDGTTQTLSSLAYQVDTYREPGLILPAYGYSWPSAREQSSAVLVLAVVGYGASASATPELAKRAICSLAGHWYENREPVALGGAAVSLPHSFDAMLALLSTSVYP